MSNINIKNGKPKQRDKEIRNVCDLRDNSMMRARLVWELSTQPNTARIPHMAAANKNWNTKGRHTTQHNNRTEGKVIGFSIYLVTWISEWPFFFPFLILFTIYYYCFSHVVRRFSRMFLFFFFSIHLSIFFSFYKWWMKESSTRVLVSTRFHSGFLLGCPLLFSPGQI